MAARSVAACARAIFAHRGELTLHVQATRLGANLTSSAPSAGAVLPSGLVADATYSVFKTYLKRGARFLLYSDGFTECKTKHGDML